MQARPWGPCGELQAPLPSLDPGLCFCHRDVLGHPTVPAWWPPLTGLLELVSWDTLALETVQAGSQMD